MEDRPLPNWALRPVAASSLTALEVLVERVGREIYSRATVTIVGAPWVNPRGRGRANASVEDYLNDPVSLYRVLEVCFNAPRASYLAESVLVAGHANLKRQIKRARDWVEPRLNAPIPLERILWYSFACDLPALLGTRSNRQNAQSLRDLARTVPLPGTASALEAFCDALRPLFP